MNKLQVAILFLLALIASGCGGGGGDSSPIPAPETEPAPTPAPEPEPEPEPEPLQLTVSVRSLNECGMYTPQTDAKLIIHNDDFSNQSVHAADSNGAFAVELLSERATVSVWSKSKGSGTPEYVEIDTFHQVTATDIGKITNSYFEDDDPNCECVDTSITLVNPSEDGRPESVSIVDREFFSYETAESGTTVESYQVCLEINGQLPALTATLSYDDTSGLTRTYAGKVTDYSLSENIVIDVTTLQQQNDIFINDELPEQFSTTSRAISQTGELLYSVRQSNRFNNNAAYFIEPEISFNQLFTYSFDRTPYTTLPDQRLYTGAGKSLSSLSGPIDFSFFEREIFANSVEDSLGKEEHDFSASAGADVFTLTTRVRDESNNRILNWRIVAPASGSLAGIENFSIDGVNFSLDNAEEPGETRVYWQIIDDENVEDYDQYIAYLAGITNTDGFDQINYRYIQIRSDFEGLFDIAPSDFPNGPVTLEPAVQLVRFLRL